MPFTALTGTLTSAIPTVMAAGALRRTAKWARGKPKAKRAATRRKTTKRKATAKKRR